MSCTESNVNGRAHVNSGHQTQARDLVVKSPPKSNANNGSNETTNQKLNAARKHSNAHHTSVNRPHY